MSKAHRREKQPDAVRRSLLDQAARHAAEDGLGAITLQSVADAAHVTKGGLLHHFPSKQALIEAVFEDLLTTLDDEIDRLMDADSVAQGSFTRAYVAAFFEVARDGDASPWAALSVSCMTDAKLRARWSQWMHERLERHTATDSTPHLAIARYAADGIWLANLTEISGLPAGELDRLHDQIKTMTSTVKP
ncbi:TetR family transcriptional regulator [Rhizobiales bacterium RZME27]|uniref:TetR family transcriptional regulator n=1 Tax=Endobacterium cereale TaxID=2663029 RepID=A0A6A8AES5_9HYPH|nr:TetR/AcrR family transcriptional regulator [Endobacterium cereale]MEB2843133.1 TetR/AcrR family transcriptional regulator [Endobacterium cereale]MQY49612.1 TetR family transcriptional regulator [Endobacterium cereale]